MLKKGRDPEKTARLRRQLLGWYKHSRRDLPWRRSADPYAIWVSEIMLQQTRVIVVVERYKSFMARFPTLVSLALAPEQEVLALWSGLGYYRRARMLHKAAQFVADQHQGNLPVTAEELRTLPGIGAYTSAAIASIAHGEPVAVVDGNVERVLCRLAGWGAGSRSGGGAALRHKVEDLAAQLVDPAHPGNFNQALMELGATVCLPRNPQCLMCPIAADCVTRGEHKTPARPKMQSREVACALSVRMGMHPGQASRQVLLEQRAGTLTVMPGMWELPQLAGMNGTDRPSFTVRHSITVTDYTVRVWRDTTSSPIGGKWIPVKRLQKVALTGLARKILRRAELL